MSEFKVTFEVAPLQMVLGEAEPTGKGLTTAATVVEAVHPKGSVKVAV